MINNIQVGARDVVFLSRDNDRKRTIKKITMPPYFYAKHPTGNFKGLFGDKLKKIETRESRDVPYEKVKYENPHECDILFVNRTLINCYNAPLNKVPIRKCYFDIENNNSLNVLTTPEPITCISVWDTFLKKYNTFVWRKDLQERKETKNTVLVDVGTLKALEDSVKHNIWYFNKEEDMIEKFIQFIRTTDPDIFIGHSLLGFDWVYIINRCKRLKLNINQIAYRGMNVYCKLRKPWNDITIPGRYTFDLHQAYIKTVQLKRLDDYTLNSMAKEVLGKEKVPVEDFTDCWKTDLPKLIERCRKDVELVRDIDNTLNLFEHYDEIRRQVGCRWEDIWNTTRYHDISFLREAKNQDIILPARPKRVKKQTFKGAIVYEPIMGLHKNVIVLDLKSMYSYIIITFNISPETISEVGDVVVEGICQYLTTKEGLCSILVKKILTKRFEAKARMKECKKGTQEYKNLDTKQDALKILANKIYGALAEEGFRMYRLECAKSITYFGREINKYSSKKAIELFEEVTKKLKLIIEKFKTKIIYGDTDSIFVKCPDWWNKDECELFGKEMAKAITDTYQEFVTSYFKDDATPPKNQLEIEYEKLYTEIFFRAKKGEEVAKKRYIGNMWYKDIEGNWKTEIETKGFEIVRRDSAIIERKIMKVVYDKILKEEKKDKIHNIVDEVKRKIKSGKARFDLFSIRRGITMGEKKDLYVFAADYGNAYLGCNFSDNPRIKLLFVNRMPGKLPLPPQPNKNNRSIAYEREEQLLKFGTKEEWLKCINWNKTFERLFDTKLTLIDKSMGWDDEAKFKQQTLL